MRFSRCSTIGESEGNTEGTGARGGGILNCDGSGVWDGVCGVTMVRSGSEEESLAREAEHR